MVGIEMRSFFGIGIHEDIGATRVDYWLAQCLPKPALLICAAVLVC